MAAAIDSRIAAAYGPPSRGRGGSPGAGPGTVNPPLRTGPAAASASIRSGRLRDCAIVTLIALASRVICVLIGAGSKFGATLDGRLPATDLLSLFVRWDAGWYLRIVATGYEASTWPQEQFGATPHAFFPGYPLLIRAAVAVTGLEPATAGIAVSTLLFVLALCLVYEYARDLGLARDTAIAATLLIACAPHSFVFSSIYTESTFLFLLVAAMLALRRRQYLWAGVAAALLSGVRPNGIVFVVFALAWTLRTAGWRPLLQPWTAPGPMLTIVLAPLGLIAYWWFCYVTTGDAFAQATSIAHGWGWEFGWPWTNLGRHLRGSSTDRFWAWGSILYFAISLLLLRFRMYEEFAFCLACFLLYWVNVLPQSLIRYALVLFPVFIALAHVTSKRPLALATLVAGLAAINGFLMVGFALQWRIAV